jgi:hypothetical protein
MTEKISEVHEKNNRYSRLVVQNASLLEENKKLDASKEELEWETNPELKNTDAIKQK